MQQNLNSQAMVGDSIMYPTNQPYPLCKLHSLSFRRSIAFNDILLSHTTYQFPNWFAETYVKGYTQKILFGKSNYSW
jgi:hypothetical protein